MHNATLVCVPCRVTARGHAGLCPHCGAEMRNAGVRWRPPKRRDDRAWARVAAGRWLTEGVPVSRHASSAGSGLPYVVRTVPAPRRRRSEPPSPWEIAERLLAAVADGDRSRAVLKALTTAARHPDPRVRRVMAASPDCPSEELTRLARDADAQTRACALANPATPAGPADLASAARCADPRVRAVAAADPRTPRAVLGILVQDRVREVAQAAAANPRTRVVDLLEARASDVPTDRIRDLLRARGTRPVRGSNTDFAVQLVASVGDGGRLRDGLDAAIVVLS